MFWVRVPVLSEQMHDVDPSVSTLSKFFTSTCVSVFHILFDVPKGGATEKTDVRSGVIFCCNHDIHFFFFGRSPMFRCTFGETPLVPTIAYCKKNGTVIQEKSALTLRSKLYNTLRFQFMNANSSNFP